MWKESSSQEMEPCNSKLRSAHPGSFRSPWRPVGCPAPSHHSSLWLQGRLQLHSHPDFVWHPDMFQVISKHLFTTNYDFVQIISTLPGNVAGNMPHSFQFSDLWQVSKQGEVKHCTQPSHAKPTIARHSLDQANNTANSTTKSRCKKKQETSIKIIVTK